MCKINAGMEGWGQLSANMVNDWTMRGLTRGLGRDLIKAAFDISYFSAETKKCSKCHLRLQC